MPDKDWALKWKVRREWGTRQKLGFKRVFPTGLNFERVFPMELDFERGFPGRVWALADYVNWALCYRHENIRVSHRHIVGDEVFKTWIPFPGFTKPTLGI